MLRFTPVDLKQGAHQDGFVFSLAHRMFTQRRLEEGFQTTPLVHRTQFLNSPMTQPLWHSPCASPEGHRSALTHRLFTSICKPFYSRSISCGSLNDILTIIYLKGLWSQKGLSEHHENWFWILGRKIRANIKMLTKIPDFLLFFT